MLTHVMLDQTVGKRIRKTYLSGDRVVLVFDDCYANVEFDEDGADDCVVLWLHNTVERRFAVKLGIATENEARSFEERHNSDKEALERVEYERLKAKFGA